MSDEELKRLHARLNELDFERKKIVLKIANIQKQTTVFAGNSILNQVPETPEDKRELFLKLFRCRQDIYPKRWDNMAQNKSGYSPVCLNEWKDFCPKKKKLKLESPPISSDQVYISSGKGYVKLPELLDVIRNHLLAD